MTHEQISVFMEERKWDYRAFGFAAALLERIPLLGLVFSVSNRIGAAMWAVGNLITCQASVALVCMLTNLVPPRRSGETPALCCGDEEDSLSNSVAVMHVSYRRSFVRYYTIRYRLGSGSRNSESRSVCSLRV